MKVVIIGGSAQSTPALFEYLAGAALPCALQVILAGRDKNRLESVARAAKLLSSGADINISHTRIQSAEFARALEGADVVLLQIRVGGYRGRAYDETFPLQYGICGDEGLGPGGLAAAWRAWPEIEPLLSQVYGAAPEALLIILTAPLGILVTAAARKFSRLRVAGICELPWTTLKNICHSLGENPEQTCFDYCGVNHLGWFHHIQANSRDLVSEYASARQLSDEFPSGELIAQCSGVPLKYLKLHYQSEGVIRQQRSAKLTRAKTLDELSREAYPVFRFGTRAEISATLERRAAPWYSHAVGPFLLALMGKATKTTFFLSARNESFCPGFAPDDVLEMPYTVEDGRLKQRACGRATPEHIRKLTAAFIAFEREAAQALLARDPCGIKQALALHPWTRELNNLEEMVKDITRPA